METERYPERRRCVYPLCEASVRLIFVPQFPGLPAHNVAKRMQPDHDIVNDHLTGPCPMSGQYVGFTPWDPNPPETQRLIDERMMVDTETASKIHGRKVVRDQIQRERKLVQGDRDRPPAESKTLRGPWRLGREPDEANKGDWALGGREDEDSGHISPDPHQHVPSYVGGYPMQSGVGRMLIGEAKAHLSAAITQAGAAMASGQQATEQLSGCVGVVQEAMANVHAVGLIDESPTLGAGWTKLNQAEADYRAAMDAIEEAQQACIIAQQKLQDMINAMSV
jgi:hypothetical protein